LNRKLVLLNLVLVVAVVWLGYTLRQRWLDAEARQREFLSQTVKAAQVQQLAPPPPIDKAVPADYIEVAQRTLFARDRNPNVAIDPPPPPPAPPPIPALPFYHGQMNFGTPVLILSTAANTEQKSYRAGEEVGKFKLVAFNSETVTLEFNGQNLERRLSDLAPKNDAPPPVPQQANSSVSTTAPRAPATNLGGLSSGADTSGLGTDMGAGFRACLPGDTSPAGTILNGYRKVVTQGLMGQSCHWERVSSQ
jgi:hypothetical protein